MVNPLQAVAGLIQPAKASSKSPSEYEPLGSCFHFRDPFWFLTAAHCVEGALRRRSRDRAKCAESPNPVEVI